MESPVLPYSVLSLQLVERMLPIPQCRENRMIASKEQPCNSMGNRGRMQSQG